MHGSKISLSENNSLKTKSLITHFNKFEKGHQKMIIIGKC